MSVILDIIKENIRQIEIIFEPTVNSFTKDTKKTGDARELSVKEFLESFFPESFQVKKGLIHSLDSVSQEIDCVVLAPNHPRLITPIRDVIIAEGVFAAIEVKPDISTLTEKSEFYRGLKQIASVKKLKRELQILQTGYLPPDHSIPCVIFSNKSRNLNDITSYMIDLVSKGVFLPSELPDIIMTLDNGIIYHSAYAKDCMFKDFISSQMKIEQNKIFLEIPHSDETLAFFVYLLLFLTPPEPYLCEPILKKYFNNIQTKPMIIKQY